MNEQIFRSSFETDNLLFVLKVECVEILPHPLLFESLTYVLVTFLIPSSIQVVELSLRSHSRMYLIYFLSTSTPASKSSSSSFVSFVFFIFISRANQVLPGPKRLGVELGSFLSA